MYNSDGIILPTPTNNSDFVGNGGIAELISAIHSSLDSKLSNVMTQLSGIENRIIWSKKLDIPLLYLPVQAGQTVVTLYKGSM